jgi:hypothetical protein
VIGGANASLARAGNSAYLKAMARPIPAQNGMSSATPPKARVEARVASVIVWGAAVLGALAIAAAAVLWIYYGTTVFFEMIAAGIAACF